MPVVACPKCQTKLKLSSEMLGKAIRCNSCQAAFRTPAPSSKKKPSGKSSKRSEPAVNGAKASKDTKKKKPKTLEDEIFGSGPPRPGTPDPLANFVLEDPGFSSTELPGQDNEADDSNDDLFADRQHLLNNPALKDRNPYASPSRAKGKGNGKDNELIQKYGRHARSVKAIGYCFTILNGLAFLGAIVGVVLILINGVAEDSTLSASASAILLSAVSLLYAFWVVVGLHLLKFRNWAKIAATIVCALALLGIPIGTAIGGYFLWILHSEKGKVVFSDQYRAADNASR